jgi:starch phosphorylase
LHAGLPADKAHPHDSGGRLLIEPLHRHLRQLQGQIPGAYIPDYDMDVARTLVAGSDIWLNTPLPPLPHDASLRDGGVPAVEICAPIRL